MYNLNFTVTGIAQVGRMMVAMHERFDMLPPNAHRTAAGDYNVEFRFREDIPSDQKSHLAFIKVKCLTAQSMMEQLQLVPLRNRP